MCESLLILSAGTLDDFSECVEDLTRHTDGFEEVGFAGGINQRLAGVMPIEVHYRLLQTKQVIHCADNYIDGCRVASLST